ncbi:MAG: hypothetical protein HQL71_07610 [Magnetococcales bacterium]|nr:hypothetical protein [Magnetococcales bacterium]
MKLITEIPFSVGKSAASGSAPASVSKGGLLKIIGSTKGSVLGFGMGLGSLGTIAVLAAVSVAGYSAYKYWQDKKEAKRFEEDPTEILDSAELYPVE